MEPFVRQNGLVAPMDRTNVDTDAIIPKQFLKRIERSGFGQFLFYEFRFDEAGKEIPDFTLNLPRYRGASILIARANFGCGSSREHAPWALQDYGFRVIIAPSFADIFYGNCLNNGILPIKLTNGQMDVLFERTGSTEGYRLLVDLENKTITDDQGLAYTFELDDFYTEKLQKGLDDIALTLLHEEEIEAYEKAHGIA
ncbi:3-isopropylmalate dehydratase small subunit [Anaerotalea alkaliphila]|uniref:3-isopropylmalate dehydratase small subunit n=1 Tax=Anaerotalea alkaliphila TaxID=2662126 RepID=A0A7X5KN95_9FIRM|nr:3-isopropylmalate dehydratase small subunit [Anaerotalea alkaliphila]NDL66557.1 3-isopropylmalate dehydratase small subunit [Anaerotalea alkaliphila]